MCRVYIPNYVLGLAYYNLIVRYKSQYFSATLVQFFCHLEKVRGTTAPNDTAYRLQTTQPTWLQTTQHTWLQTTQPTNGGAVTSVTNCCANCVEPSRPQQWGHDLPFIWTSRPCGPAGWLALLLTKAGDVETNPGPTTLNKRVWICDICYKQIHVMKQISIRYTRVEHWVHLRCADIRQAQYTDTWTCHLHR